MENGELDQRLQVQLRAVLGGLCWWRQEQPKVELGWARCCSELSFETRRRLEGSVGRGDRHRAGPRRQQALDHRSTRNRLPSVRGYGL